MNKHKVSNKFQSSLLPFKRCSTTPLNRITITHPDLLIFLLYYSLNKFKQDLIKIYMKNE